MLKTGHVLNMFNVFAEIPEKPRIWLGCPSRSTFSQAPQKLLLLDFGRKSTVIGPPGGEFNSTPGTCLNSTLGVA